jgi:hypothetical protein
MRLINAGYTWDAANPQCEQRERRAEVGNGGAEVDVDGRLQEQTVIMPQCV